MEISVIKIGNSKGIRLSKAIIEQYQIKDKVELIMEKEYIILKPMAHSRSEWDAAFRQMNENGDDHLLFDDAFEDETLEEWI